MLAFMLAAAALPAGTIDRAERNWIAVFNGTRAFTDLSPVERQEVLLLDRARREARVTPPETRETCVAREQSTAPSRLEEAVVDLKCSQRR